MTKTNTDPQHIEGLLAATFDSLTDGLAIYDANERFVMCNAEFRSQLAPISALLTPGTPWRVILQACIDNSLAIGLGNGLDDLDTQCDALRQAGERRTEVRQMGGRFVDLSYNPLPGGGFFITRADVTEKLERDELIRIVVEASPVPILMNRAETGEILFISPPARALYGDLTSSADYYVSPKDREAFIGELRRHQDVNEYRLKLKNAKGEPFWCAVSARLIQLGGHDVVVSHSRDLTGQLAIEQQLARQREQVFQSEKMSALGSLLAGVAHELNNPLSVVVGHAMMLSDETADPDVLRKIKKISDAAERCSKIVRTFLTMARQEPVRMGAVDLKDLIETAVDVARYGSHGQTVKIATQLEDGLPQINADQDQITQALVNLIINAQQAIEAEGIGDSVSVVAQYDTQRDQLRIVVEDNGPGIPSEVRGRVFEPFFTTKGVGVGTGIGLAVCHRVVAAHKGKIEVGTIEPHGTRFTITLPVGKLSQADEDMVKAVAATEEKIRVLVIDDEVDVADLNVEVLERGGYLADAVYQAEDALDMLRNQRYDVVLSDLNMPGLDGRGIFEAISQKFPELVSRTGFVTGDSMGRASQTFLKESRRPYIEKPVSPKELCAFVAQLGMEGEPT